MYLVSHDGYGTFCPVGVTSTREKAMDIINKIISNENMRMIGSKRVDYDVEVVTVVKNGTLFTYKVEEIDNLDDEDTEL